MNKQSIALLFLWCFLTGAWASDNDLFRVAPYLLKKTDGTLLLNFQTNIDTPLIISDDGVERSVVNFKKEVQQKISLTDSRCGQIKEIKILDGNNRDVLFHNTQPPAHCLSENIGPMVFGFISDTQQYKDRHEEIAKIVAHHHALEPMQFLINGGDVVQEGADEREWLNYFLGGQLYLKDIPQIAAIGNHDYRGRKGNQFPHFFQQFMRWEGSDALGNLFFDFPQFELLILNSNFSEFTPQEERKVWQWLDEKMSAASAINKPMIIATHFPIFSSSLNQFTSLAVIKMRSYLLPLVEKYKVKLVLSGHTHVYERSKKGDVNFLVAGPAGGRVNKPTYKNEYVQFIDKESLTFTKLKFDHQVLFIETYNQDNKLIDQLNIKY